MRVAGGFVRVTCQLVVCRIPTSAAVGPVGLMAGPMIMVFGDPLTVEVKLSDIGFQALAVNGKVLAAFIQDMDRLVALSGKTDTEIT